MNARHGIRLAEIVGALSLGIDLGFGQPMEHVLRQCCIALRLADLVGLDRDQRTAVYYTSLLVNVGCHADAHEQARWFGDDIKLKSTKYGPDFRSFRSLLSGVTMIGAGAAPLHRFRLGLEFALSGHREVDQMIDQHAGFARMLAEELKLPPTVLDGLSAAYERWDGRGWPGTLKGGAIPVAARIAQLAEHAEVAYRVGGIAAVSTLATKRSGGQFDPQIARLMAKEAPTVLAGLDGNNSWAAVIERDPGLGRALTDEETEQALRAIGSFVDLKAPFMLGHSPAVATLAAKAAHAAGLDPREVAHIKWAGYVHELGRLGVSNAIWDKRAPLGTGEWERVRLHPYLAERMLAQSAGLAEVGAIVAQHAERLDGSGYPRGLAGGAISREARFLAAADVYQAMREDRPHRLQYSAQDAATLLRSEARRGRLDAEAVEAVLGVAGHRVLLRREGPAGLTSREVEILRLVARGLSNREIALRLTISAKTVGNHIEHIYTKIGGSGRAAASVFAVQQGLLPEEVFP